MNFIVPRSRLAARVAAFALQGFIRRGDGQQMKLPSGVSTQRPFLLVVRPPTVTLRVHPLIREVPAQGPAATRNVGKVTGGTRVVGSRGILPCKRVEPRLINPPSRMSLGDGPVPGSNRDGIVPLPEIGPKVPPFPLRLDLSAMGPKVGGMSTGPAMGPKVGSGPWASGSVGKGVGPRHGPNRPPSASPRSTRGLKKKLPIEFSD